MALSRAQGHPDTSRADSNLTGYNPSKSYFRDLVGGSLCCLWLVIPNPNWVLSGVRAEYPNQHIIVSNENKPKAEYRTRMKILDFQVIFNPDGDQRKEAAEIVQWDNPLFPYF